MLMRFLAVSLAVALVRLEPVLAADVVSPEKWLFAVQVYTEGFFLNPTVARVVVIEVFPNSQGRSWRYSGR